MTVAEVSTPAQRAGGSAGGGGHAPAILAHLNLLFVLYAGALLLTGARLKWDPSLYVPLREVLPCEYCAAAVALPLAALALLALAHLAVRPLHTQSRTVRRKLYLIYACCMCVALCVEVALGGWLWWRVRALVADAETQMQGALEVRDQLLHLLEALDRYHPLPNHIKEILKEAEADLPWCVYVSCAACVVLLCAQVAAAALALLARTRDAPSHAHSRSLHNTTYKTINKMNGAVGQEAALLQRARRPSQRLA